MVYDKFQYNIMTVLEYDLHLYVLKSGNKNSMYFHYFLDMMILMYKYEDCIEQVLF